MGIKPKKGDPGKHLKPTEDKVFPATFYNYPIFCLRFLHKDYHIDKCEKDQKVCLLDQMHKLSTTNWQMLSQSHKHGMGFEKIALDNIKPSMPSHITPDVTMYAFRFDGKKPFVGYRNSFIFHILYIDRDFTVYNHG